ncbi:MAG: hypothetical protein A2075_25170 [Geobacteraceae bacterium GWC2_58_44]|nr:MAG: hypothetical protein A2075_25170 [Geobacteraceae bacterium GWC2_58_44]HBG05347.1 hypothetical protein [Geobacter sp.]
MGIFDRVRDRLKDPALAELVKEQSLKDLLTRREFHLPESYLQREFVSSALDDEILELSLAIFDGYGEIRGKIKKRLLPFPITFSARFAIQGMEFSSARKIVFLKLEQVAPIDIDWLTKKMVQRIPFLSCFGDLIACDLTRVPRLAELFAYRVKGISLWDFITLKELSLKDGEIVGRVGVVI